jgi:hypothetical protein
LPAISSLAGKFEERGQQGDQYLAGLWKFQLPTSLLWTAKHKREVETKETLESDEPAIVKSPQTWASWLKTILPLAKAKDSTNLTSSKKQSFVSEPPTWSWASVECSSISWEDKIRHIVAEVLDATTYPSTIDPLGMVSGGYLTIRSEIFPLEDIWVRSDSMAFNEIKIAVIPSPGLQLTSGVHHFVECQLDDPSQFASSNHGTFKTKMHFLVIGKHKHDYGFLPCQGLVLSTVRKEELGLSLQGASSDGKYLYRRVGLGTFNLPSSDYLGPTKAYQKWYTPRTVTIV